MEEKGGMKSLMGVLAIAIILLVITLLTGDNEQPNSQSDNPTSDSSTQVANRPTVTASNTVRPSRTPRPTSTRPIGPFGVEVSIEYQQERFRNEFNVSQYRNAIPSTWIAEPNAEARYRLEYFFMFVGSRRCGLYTSFFDDIELMLDYIAINLRVKVIDLVAEEETELFSETFSPSLPADCPFTYEFETVRDIPQDTTEWQIPLAADVRAWLITNVRSLSDMPPTATPTQTPTVTPTITLIDESSLIFTGVVHVRFENNNRIVTEIDGEYPLIAILPDRYIIIYNGERAYVRISSANVSPSIPPTMTPDLIIFTGTVIIRDENNDEIARETEGEYVIIRIENDYYVINYNGQEAYVHTSSSNVSPSTIIIED